MQRYRTVIILVLLAVVPLVVAVLVARYFVTPDAPATVPARTTAAAPQPVKKSDLKTVLAAARDLPVGTLLGGDELSRLEFAPAEIRRGYVVLEGPTTVDSLRGYAVREAVAAGAPLTWSAIVGPGQRGFLAAALMPGTRAVTIQLGRATRQAGLIDPGDRVDVILTAKLRLSDGEQSVFTRRILDNVRVVAVDRRFGDEAKPAKKGGEQVERAEIATATLEVSPAQADRLALGEHEGKLSLSVRSLATSAYRRTPAAAVHLQELLPVPEEPDEAGPETAELLLAPEKKVSIIRGSEITVQTFPSPGGTEPAAAGAPDAAR